VPIEDEVDAGTGNPFVDAGPGAGADSPDACGCRTLDSRRSRETPLLLGLLLLLGLALAVGRKRVR
jgi:hypothetical protein